MTREGTDILIKGIEMPRGNNVLIVDSAGTITKVNRWTGKVEVQDPFSVKAVALPEHGDLIDEDEFRLVIYREIRNHKEDEPITMILKGILWEMDNSPVIVEAST